jgi:RHS repeat-associated protein
MNLNGIEYYYIRNAQGDIIGLYDKNGIQVVSYIYDSWGKLISIDGSLKDTVGVKNPYRYRGYRYDSETGLYYLQSRYYNPEWGRFINADGIAGQIGELLGHNVFNYCKNDPVNLQDPSGFKMVFADEETQRQYDQWIRLYYKFSK